MAKIKELILKLEEEGIIEWSDEKAMYLLITKNGKEEFDLMAYLKNKNIKEGEK